MVHSLGLQLQATILEVSMRVFSYIVSTLILFGENLSSFDSQKNFKCGWITQNVDKKERYASSLS